LAKKRRVNKKEERNKRKAKMTDNSLLSGEGMPLLQQPVAGSSGGAMDGDKKRFSPVPDWLRLSLVYLACICAAGPLSAFPTIQPLLVNAGVFYQGDSPAEKQAQLDQLSGVYTIAMGVSVGSFFILGYLYDATGARFSGFVGALGVAVGMAILWLATLFKPLHFLVYIGFPLADMWVVLCPPSPLVFLSLLQKLC
jgi:hypothetical protein